MIFLIHGENEIKIQEEFDTLKKREKPNEVIRINPEEITPVEFGNKVLTPNMFGFKNLFVIDSSSLPQKDLLQLIERAQKAPENTSIVFLLSKNLRSNSKILKAIKETKNSKVIQVEKDKDYTIFNFLDSVFGKNRKKAYSLLEELIQKEEPPFKIHSMLVYQLRKVAKTKFGAKVSGPPFVKKKFKRQAGNFTEQKILKLYEHFYQTDRDMKLGLIPDNILIVRNIEKVMEG